MKKDIQKLSILVLAVALVAIAAPISASASSNPTASYCTHVQNVGWQDYVSNGLMSGTEGKSYRLEGIKIKLDTQGYDLGITYQTHIQNIGWEADTSRGWKSNDTMSGTEALSYRLEAIQIKLTGADADKFDIYYQVHAQNIGWMGWAKNGESAGTAGFGYRLEGIRIVIVPAGSASPGSTDKAFVQPSTVEQALNKINGTWVLNYSGGSNVYKITKTSPATGHITLTMYKTAGSADSVDFNFWINSINSDETTTLFMDMNSIVSGGITPNFNTIPATLLMNDPNSLILFKGKFSRQ